jgi:hypothetical protein
MEEAIVKGLSPGETGRGIFDFFEATSENLGYRDHLGGRLAASADSFHGRVPGDRGVSLLGPAETIQSS